MFISPAFAQSAAGGGSAGLAQLLPFVLIFVVFYFFLIRPQQKRAKEHQAMVNNLKRGDKVTTAGGITGTVSKAVDGQETVEVEIAPEVKVSVVRTMISSVLDKNGNVPAPADKAKKDAPKKDAAKKAPAKKAASKKAAK